ncbi:MAG: hypothetical protein JXA14_16905 [Anaerolineae bacterium]|nr:hypothetical protein [Anaerolineae bacterium]
MRLRASSDGTLWLITDESAAKLVDTTWSVYLPAYTGEMAGIDASGRVWVLSEDASEISAWGGDSWTTYGVDAGWIPLASDEHRYVSGGQSDALGRPWFATSQDVRVFDGERWIVITPEDMGMEATSYEDFSPSLSVTILESTGEVWVSECVWGPIGPAGGSGVRWFDGRTWHGADSPVASGCAPMIKEDLSGHIWVGTSNILWRYDPVSGNWAQFRPDVSTAFLILNAVPGPSGDLWVSITPCGGSCFNTIVLYHAYIHDGAWVKVLEYEGFFSPTVILDAADTPWLFHEGIIYRIAEDVPEPVAHLDTGPVVVDAAGRVWFVAKREGQDWLWTLDQDAE